jgi:hypothetical protein
VNPVDLNPHQGRSVPTGVLVSAESNPQVHPDDKKRLRPTADIVGTHVH